SILNAINLCTMPLDHKEESSSAYTTNITSTLPAKAIKMGWNCFDVQLAYDDQYTGTSGPEQILKVSTYDSSTSNITLNGDIELNTEGTIITTNSKNPFNSVSKSASTMVGDYAKDKVVG
ncbi:MAG: hypothetical protein LUD68_00750, partial [Rikenellaceae bacterium]|nr:hypothetical protein [Rikenellaceae bacterium]